MVGRTADFRQNGFDILKRLFRLGFDAFGHSSGCRVDRKLTGYEYHITRFDCLTVRTDRRRSLCGCNYFFHLLFYFKLLVTHKRGASA